MKISQFRFVFAMLVGFLNNSLVPPTLYFSDAKDDLATERKMNLQMTDVDEQTFGTDFARGLYLVVICYENGRQAFIHAVKR